MKRQKHILFGYSCTPSCGFYGKDDGGFSIEVDTSGILVYKTYLFDFIEQTKRTIVLSSNTTNRIKNILKNNIKTIENFNKQLNNDSYDGSCNRFIFSGKEIISWNIQFTNIWFIWLLAIINLDYYKKHVNNIKQKNAVLHIFKLIANVLESEGIRLTLDKIVLHFDKE